MIDKNKAIVLRKQGLSYADIAKELSCSVVWCKKNLSNVTKNIKEKTSISLLVQKAKSKEGLTSGEIFQEMNKNKEPVIEFDLDSKLSKRELKEQELKIMRRLKSKVKEQPNTVIRPYWMKPTEARKAFNLVLQAVNLIDERLYEEVQYIMQELDLDESYIKSLTRAITQMSQGGNLLVPVNITEMNYNLTKTADELEKRNSP